MRKMNFKRFLCVFATLAMILVAIPAVEVKAAQDVTVHFKNTLSWSTVNVYSWEKENSNKEVFGAWPGTDITETANGEWYTATVLSHNYNSVWIIFNDGSAQTMDIELDVTKGTEWWLVPNGDDAGKVTVCAATNKADAEAGKATVGSTPSTPSTPSTSVVKSPVIEGDKVTFYYESATATEVAVAGAMNEWSTTEDMMVKEGNMFSYTMWLDDGTYEYKFVVDGEWTVDPGNPETAGDYGNSVFVIGDGVSDKPVDDGTTNDTVTGGSYTYTIYGYSTDATRNTTTAAAIWIWDKTNSGEGQEVLFTETEELADGRTWVKAVVVFEASAQTGFILKSAGSWTWQTADLIYDNTSETAVTLYLVDGHDTVYTSLDDIEIEDPVEDTTSEELTEDTDTTEVDKDTATEKEPLNPVVIAWIVVAIVVIGVAVAAFFVVKKLTADLPASEEGETEETKEEVEE